MNSLETIEKDANEITEANLSIMNGEMLDFLCKESIGGNAGSILIDGKKFTAVVANGYADPETGKIIAFSNSPMHDFAEFSFRLAVDTTKLKEFLKNKVTGVGGAKEIFFKVVNVFPNNEKMTGIALKNIVESANLYNSN